MTYDDYVWRLYSEAPFAIYDTVLPKDLEWIDEFSWNPIFQEISNSVTGSIFINEYEQLDGRFITLEGKEDMGWIQRPLADNLLLMRNDVGLKMKLDFVSASFNEITQQWTFGAVHISKNVMFRQNDAPIEFESIKRFDNFEPSSWFKIKNLKFMEIDADVGDPCS